LRVATHTATEDGKALHLCTLIEVNVTPKAGGIASDFTEFLDNNGSAKGCNVAVYMAADMYTAAETGNLGDLFVGADEDVMAKLRSVVRAVGKRWRTKRCDAEKADHEPE